MNLRRESSLSGFSLLELAVVLVILSIIIGSIIITQSMIRDAQLRNAAGEMQRYIQVIGEFRDKYQALPGDFAGATALWGTSAGGCPAGVGSGTCNGDGNGRISTQTAATFYEEFRAWQHLSYANLIEATVTGTAGGGGAHDRLPGINIPGSYLDGAGWGLTSVFVSDIGVTVTDLPYITGDIPPNHILWLGGLSVDFLTNQQHAVLRTVEAATIDSKVDDGFPNTGKVIAQISLDATVLPYNCAVDSVTPTADYNFALINKTACTLIFKTGF